MNGESFAEFGETAVDQTGTVTNTGTWLFFACLSRVARFLMRSLH